MTVYGGHSSRTTLVSLLLVVMMMMATLSQKFSRCQVDASPSMVITTTDPGTSSSNVAAAAAATQQQQQRDGGIPLNVSDDASIRHAASVAAYSLQSFYNGNRTGGTLGKFPYPPYYWWLSGAAWDGMLHYWLFTGDESYNNITWMALVSQISPTNNYLPVAEMFDEVCISTSYLPGTFRVMHDTGLVSTIVEHSMSQSPSR